MGFRAAMSDCQRTIPYGLGQVKSIKINQLPDEVIRALRDEAAREGISVEEKARRILTLALVPERRRGLGDTLREIATGVNLDETVFERDRSGIEGADFGQVFRI